MLTRSINSSKEEEPNWKMTLQTFLHSSMYIQALSDPWPINSSLKRFELYPESQSPRAQSPRYKHIMNMLVVGSYVARDSYEDSRVLTQQRIICKIAMAPLRFAMTHKGVKSIVAH